jgi:sugar phosphate isomerase/epimerase
MKIGVSSYSFQRLVSAGKMTYFEVLAKAKEMGFDAFEFSAILVPEGKTLREFAYELRAESDRIGLPIVNYAVGADFINGSEKNLDAEIERVKESVDIAEILGAPKMRHDATGGFRPGDQRGRTFEDALPFLVKGCRAVTEYAAQKGIRTMVENHGFFCQDSIRVEQLVTAVNHSNFGLLVDMGNFVCADEDPAVAVGRTLPYAYHVHAKDFHLKSGRLPHPGRHWWLSRGGTYICGTIIGYGDVPVVQCLKAMKRMGYDDVLSIEFEGVEDVLMGIEVGLENLRRYVAEVYGS